MNQPAQDGLILLDQMLSAAPATRPQHDACRQILGEIVKMRAEYNEMKQRFAVELEKEPLLAPADAPPAKPPVDVDTRSDSESTNRGQPA